MTIHNANNIKAPRDGCAVPSLTVADFYPDDGWLENIARLLILARSSNSYVSTEPRLNQKKAH